MWEYLRKPHNDLAALTLRLGLAVILISYGYIKVSIKGGTEWTGILEPEAQAVVAWSELIGGLALLVGFLSRLAALGVIVIQAGAIFLVSGDQLWVLRSNPEGMDLKNHLGFGYNFMIMVASAALIFLGSGIMSIDHFLFGRKKPQ